MSGPDYMRQTDSSYASFGGTMNEKRTDPTERLLIDRWSEIETIAESDDPHADYSFDDYALIRLDETFYVINASGCSCPSQEEVWCVSLSGTRAEIEGVLRKDSKNESEAWREFQRACAKAGWDVPSPEPRTAYDWSDR